MSELKPSDVSLLSTYPPLAGAFGKVEAEAAAAVIIRACQLNGDRFQPVNQDMVQATLKHDFQNKTEPLASCVSNPFWKSDPGELCERGFARWVGNDTVELLPRAFDVLRRYTQRGLFGGLSS